MRSTTTATRTSTWTSALAGAVLILALLATIRAEAETPPSVDDPELARGPYASMHMLFTKTILGIKVANVDMRVDRPTQARLADLARNHGYAPELAARLALASFSAGHAVVQMQFLRDIPFNRWLGVVRDSVAEARKAGLITPAVEQRVSELLPRWFAPIADRGYKKGDRLIYAVRPDGLRSVVVSPDGQTLVDRTEAGPDGRRVVLGSYFASGSEFREPMLRSLFTPAPP
jgi:hypothetical protein